MSHISEYISIKDVFSCHFKSLKVKRRVLNSNNTKLVFTRSVKNTFLYYPVIISALMALVFGSMGNGAKNITGVSLSIFIGLFLNILVLLVSVIRNDMKIKDVKGRNDLIKDTFYNVCYTIAISIIALLLLFVYQVSIPQGNVFLTVDILIRKIEISYSFFLVFIFNTLYYVILINIILTLLMILKRVFKLFEKEIDSESNHH